MLTKRLCDTAAHHPRVIGAIEVLLESLSVANDVLVTYVRPGLAQVTDPTQWAQSIPRLFHKVGPKRRQRLNQIFQ